MERAKSPNGFTCTVHHVDATLNSHRQRLLGIAARMSKAICGLIAAVAKRNVGGAHLRAPFADAGNAC
jgi:hypothetical protein